MAGCCRKLDKIGMNQAKDTGRALVGRTKRALVEFTKLATMTGVGRVRRGNKFWNSLDVCRSMSKSII
jgi:hypothetical protein